MTMKKPNQRHAALAVAAAAILAAVLAIVSCAGFAFEKKPDYVPGTRLEIRTTDRGEDYWIAIGETETTQFEAVLSGRGECFLAYRYQDRYWLDVRSVTVDVGRSLPTLRPARPQREETDEVKRESDLIPVRRNLYRSILEADGPLIALEGDGGTVVLAVGSQGKARIAELLEYADRMWPDVD